MTVSEKLQKAPLWVVSTVIGVVHGTVMTVIVLAQTPGNWGKALVLGPAQGVFLGVIMGRVIVRQRRAVSAATGDLSAHDLRLAGRAAQRGPVPSDPRIRQAARWLATRELDQFSRSRWFVCISLMFFLVLTVFSALTDSPWYWFAAAVVFAFSGFFLIWPGHVRKRLKLLEEPDLTTVPL